MNKIKFLYVHIIVVLLIVIVSYFVCDNYNKKMTFYDSKEVALSFSGYKELLVLSDEDYLRTYPSDIILKNTSDEVLTTNVYYKYSKKSSINYSDISISFDNKIYKLSDIKPTEDADSLYFYIDKYTLNSYESNTIKTRIWTSSTSGNVTSTFINM